MSSQEIMRICLPMPLQDLLGILDAAGKIKAAEANMLLVKANENDPEEIIVYVQGEP